MVIRKILLFFVVLLIFSCHYPDLKKAEETSNEIIKNIQKDDWNTIWEESSITYQKKITLNRFHRLKMWANNELGKVKSFKKTYSYCGSSITIPGENFVNISYEMKFAKGQGRIDITLIEENNKFRIFKLDFIKKPVY
jgi:hypothetical protein